MPNKTIYVKPTALDTYALAVVKARSLNLSISEVITTLLERWITEPASGDKSVMKVNRFIGLS